MDVVWDVTSSTLLDRTSVIIFMMHGSLLLLPSLPLLSDMKPRKTTVRQRGSRVVGSTVAICTKFPPRIFLDFAIETLIISLQVECLVSVSSVESFARSVKP